MPTLNQPIVKNSGVKPLPKEFQFVHKLGTLPKVIQEFLKVHGTLEYKGDDNNPSILSWAKEVSVPAFYNADSTPWCGLLVAICVKRAGYKVVNGFLAGINWHKFGTQVKIPDACFGDIVIFSRQGGHHVGFYFAETDMHYAIGGGNQSDAVNIMWIEKSRAISVRRCIWKIAQPKCVRKYFFNSSGIVSENEI